MISTLFIWLYIALLALGYGLVADATINKLLTRAPSPRPTWLIIVLLGVSGLGALLTLLSLFAPMTAITHVIAVVVLLAGLIILRPPIRADIATQRKGPALPFVIGGAAAVVSTVLVLGFAVNYPDHYDSGLYHAQSIRWIDEYPAVPGLANLHPRLAFNSSWHVLESFFGMSFLHPDGFRPLNGLLLVVTACAGLLSIAALARGDVRPSRLMSAAMFPLSIHYFQRHIASPLTDTPATLIAWLVWVATLNYLEREDRPRIDRESAALAIIACFLVAVKLSALPAVLVALVALGRPWKWPVTPAVGLGLAGSLVLLPWVLRSVVLSGTPVFPLSWVAPLPLEWAVSRGQIELEETITRAWARIPMRAAAEVIALPPSEWIPLWWTSIGEQFRAVLTLLIFGPMVLALLLPRSMELVRSVVRHSGQYLALIVVGYVGVFLWFVSAPDVRFGVGTLVPLALMLVIPIVLTAHRWAPVPVRALLVALLLMPPWSTLGESLELISQPERLMIPASYYSARTRVLTTNGFPVLVSTGTDQCWNSPLPCTPVLNPNLILRGCTLDAGFRISATPELERRTDCAPMSSVQGRSRDPDLLPAPRIERVLMRRRNQESGSDIDCDAERQNEIRVLVRNRGAPVSDASLAFVLDDVALARRAIGTLDSNDERWIDTGSTLRPRKGDHVLQVRVLGTGDVVDDERRVEVRCS